MARTIYHAVKAIQSGEFERRGGRHFCKDENGAEICLEDHIERFALITGIRRENVLRDGFRLPFHMRYVTPARLASYEARLQDYPDTLLDLDEHFEQEVAIRRAEIDIKVAKHQAALIEQNPILAGCEWRKSIEGNFVMAELWKDGQRVGKGTTSEDAVHDAAQELATRAPMWQRTFAQFCASVVLVPVVRDKAKGRRVVVDNGVNGDEVALGKLQAALKRFTGDSEQASTMLRQILNGGLDVHAVMYTIDPDRRGPAIVVHQSGWQPGVGVLRAMWEDEIRMALNNGCPVPTVVLNEAKMQPPAQKKAAGMSL